MNKPIVRGDIYFVNFGKVPGSFMQGIRPAMILQNNVGNSDTFDLWDTD